MRWLSRIFVLLLLSLLGTAPKPDVPRPERVGWVDMARLRAIHPDYDRLRSADAELDQLLRQRDDSLFLAERDVGRQNEKWLRRAAQDGLAELEDYQRSLDREFTSYSQGLEARSRARLLEIQADYEKQVALRYRPYQQDLAVMAGRSRLAFRLEQQKALDGELRAEWSRRERQLALAEDELSRRFQDEKLNLLLRLEQREDPAARRRLDEIARELEAGCEEKRRQVRQEFAALEQSQRHALERRLALNEERLRDELARAQAPPAALAQAAQAAESARRRELEAVQGLLKSRRRQLAERLRARQAELQKGLGRLRESLRRGSPYRVQQLARWREWEGRLARAQERRRALLRKMDAQIGPAIAEVARQRAFPACWPGLNRVDCRT